MYMPMSGKKVINTLVIGAFLTLCTSSYALNLADIFTLAENNDPTFLSSSSQRDADTLLVDKAKSALRPSINGQGTVDRAYNNANNDRYSTEQRLAISLNYPLYNKQVGTAVEQAKVAIERSSLSFEVAQTELMSRTVTLYFEYLNAQQDLKLAQQELAIAERQLESAKAFFEVGLTAITDVREIEAQKDLAEVGLISAENNVQLALDSIELLTNADVSAVSPLIDPEQNPSSRWTEQQPLDYWLSLGQENNRSAQIAALDLEDSRLTVERLRASRYPTLSATGSISHNDISNLEDEQEARIGLQLDVPIYTGGLTSAQVKEATYLYNKAQQDNRSALQSLEQSVRSAYLAHFSAVKTIPALKQSVISTELAAEAATLSFENGTRSSLDVLLAERESLSSRKNLVQGYHQIILSYITLKQASGTLSVSDIKEINKLLEP